MLGMICILAMKFNRSHLNYKMKPIYQTVIDKNSGDCLRAALASLLEIDEVESIPNFSVIRRDWHMTLIHEVQNRGFEYIGMRYRWNKELNTIQNHDGVDGLFLAAVYSPKFYNANDAVPVTHSVIIDKNFNIVHDPNPNNKDVKKYPKADELGCNGILYFYIIEKCK